MRIVWSINFENRTIFLLILSLEKLLKHSHSSPHGSRRYHCIFFYLRVRFFMCKCVQFDLLLISIVIKKSQTKPFTRRSLATNSNNAEPNITPCTHTFVWQSSELQFCGVGTARLPAGTEKNTKVSLNPNAAELFTKEFAARVITLVIARGLAKFLYPKQGAALDCVKKNKMRFVSTS